MNNSYISVRGNGMSSENWNGDTEEFFATVSQAILVGDMPLGKFSR